MMLRLLLVTAHKQSLSDFASSLTECEDVQVSWAASGDEALEMASENVIDVVVTDERLGDMTGLELARKLVALNPVINCASLSSLSPEAFHEASEGLGLLAQLPIRPDKKNAEDLLHHLKKIKDLEHGA
ncbi:MAG: response regulator [Deltaproteobacteria bacterium]|nr:response regulator [Deltaproteobacteria bacterium]